MFQSQHDEIEAKFFEERAALQAKYQKLYEPLYAKVLQYYNYHWPAPHPQTKKKSPNT